MTVIYTDSVFFLNMLMDYLLFLATARLAGVPLHRKRYFLAAFLGGSYAVACFLPGALPHGRQGSIGDPAGLGSFWR